MKTFKRIFFIGLRGGTIGITVGLLFALTFSFIFHTSSLVPSGPQFYMQFSNITVATAVSIILWFLMGLVFSIGSLVFLKENWSITKQTVIHFLITFFGFTPLAILAGWFPLDAFWLGFYLVVFILMYVVMWSISMSIARSKVNEINAAIKKLIR